MESEDSRQTRDILRALPLFRHFDDAALAELAPFLPSTFKFHNSFS